MDGNLWDPLTKNVFVLLRFDVAVFLIDFFFSFFKTEFLCVRTLAVQTILIWFVSLYLKRKGNKVSERDREGDDKEGVREEMEE